MSIDKEENAPAFPVLSSEGGTRRALGGARTTEEREQGRTARRSAMRRLLAAHTRRRPDLSRLSVAVCGGVSHTHAPMTAAAGVYTHALTVLAAGLACQLRSDCILGSTPGVPAQGS